MTKYVLVLCMILFVWGIKEQTSVPKAPETKLVGQTDRPRHTLQTGQIERIAPMSTARAAHTMTLLGDGRVLIVGGMPGQSGRIGRTELFSPHSNSFQKAGQMKESRFSHSATVLADGNILIAGGYNDEGEYLKSTEIYEPRTDQFTSGPDMTETRAGHKAVQLQDGRVLIVGGVGTGWTFLSSAEIYDPKANRFSTTGSMQFKRESHSAIGLPDGSVIVLGGHVGRRSAMRLYDQVERFDPVSETFGPAGTMKIARHKQDATLLPDGTILISGGADTRDFNGVFDTTEIYDPRSETSTMSNTLRVKRFKHEGNSIVTHENQLLFAGGAAQAERLDLGTGKAHLIPGETDLAGQFSASILLNDGRVLITGGYGQGTGPRPSAWMYTPGI